MTAAACRPTPSTARQTCTVNCERSTVNLTTAHPHPTAFATSTTNRVAL